MKEEQCAEEQDLYLKHRMMKGVGNRCHSEELCNYASHLVLVPCFNQGDYDGPGLHLAWGKQILEIQKFGKETAYEGRDVRNIHCEYEAHLTYLWKFIIRKVHPERKSEWMDW
jgi:hypothetical protein